MERTLKKQMGKIVIGLFVLVVMLIAGSGYSSAANQVITLSPSAIDKTSGDEFIVTVIYNVSDKDNTLSSLGVRVHFDSTRLDYKGFENFFDTASLADPQLQDDRNNEDKDDSTDKLVNLSYSDPFNKNWPNEPLPLELVKFRFELRNDAPEGRTSINVTKITGHVDYGFDGVGSTIISKTRKAMPWLMLLLADDSLPTAGAGDPWRVVVTESGTDNLEVNFMSVAFNGSQVTATDLCEPDLSYYGTLNGSDITISYTSGSGAEIVMTGTVSADTISGSFTADGYPVGTWQAQKLNQALDPKTCVTDTAEARCYYYPWSDSFGIMAYLEDFNSLVQSAVISGSYITGTSPLTYELYRGTGWHWQTDPNPVISYGVPAPFPLTYTVHVVFKDGTTADLPFSISGYEIAE